MVGDLLLVALLDGPAHGYELMDRLEATTGGSWRPSPGSVYPLLQAFEESGLITGHESDGRRVFRLTEAGRAQATERREQALAAAVAPGNSQHGALREELQQLHAAGRQVALAASPEQVEQAIAIVRGARQALYRLLAEQ
jgi:DNA-binding PadR family transcriptional regulator